jgi:hypothetical protein
MHRIFIIDGMKRGSLFRIRPGFLLAVILLLAYGCSGPPLKPWHTERLTAEFTAGKTDEIRTFDDYRQLEDRLFAQLEEKVYAVTATGPEFALVRYSSGSAADPQKREHNWNRSFELSSRSPVGGVLLLHGMSDSPYSLRARDCPVTGRRLRGCGESNGRIWPLWSGCA